jgi:DNA repair photolyase
MKKSQLKKLIKLVLTEARSNPIADKLMAIDTIAWKALGARTGTDIEKKWEDYIDTIESHLHYKYKNKKFDKKVIDALENENYHSLIQALIELGYTK